MKKLTLFIAIALIFQSTQGQVTDSVSTDTNQEMYEFLMTKSKKQNKAGLIMLGAGVVSSIGGIIIANQSDDWSDAEFASGTLLLTAGLLTTVSSIPVLIVAGSNKKKAEAYVQLQKFNTIDLNLPNSQAVTVGVKFEF